MKYLVKIDYFCPEVQKGGKWFIVESEQEPRARVIDNRPFEGSDGPLGGYGCKMYYTKQSCDEESSCNWQTIMEVKLYSEEEAKKLNAQESDLEIKTNTRK